MIIAFLGKTVNEYRKNYPIFLSHFTPICPLCDQNCQSHCWYKRKIREPELAIIKILRVKCANKNCGATHAILPDFIYPKGRYSEQMREATIIGYENEGKTQEAVSQVQSVKTTRRWIKRYRDVIKRAIAALQSILARLRVYEFAVIGSGLEQLQQLSCRIEKEINPLISSSRFGKVNVLFSWQNMELWI
jgi:hypothetical protein